MKYTTINGVPRFALPKWSATVFATIGRNKKAPMDEQAVRFCVYGGEPLVWATDGYQVVVLRPEDETRVSHHDVELRVLASSLKTLVAKARVSQVVLIDPNSFDVCAAGAKVDLAEQVEVSVLGTAAEATPCEYGRAHFEHVTAALGTESESGAPRWSMSSAFASTYAAIAKASGGAGAWWLNPPPHPTAPLVVRVRDGVDGGRWMVATMPRMPGV
jgi:hypothetical protein